MKNNVYTLFYAGVLGTVCSLLLTAAASFTKPYQQANAKAEKNRNILGVLQVPYPAESSSQELVKIFEDNVSLEQKGALTMYRYVPPKDSGNKETVAVGFEGPGLWGPVKGFLALGRDMRTIRGVTFYEQEETPGLGGEIAASWFREQFVGKSIVDEAGNPGIIISSSEGTAPNKVDAISGATMTCDKVQAMLNEAIKSVVEEKQ
ncbi:MAG TPA: FMN-binding protein [Sedimentisphaerales bacterium]|nr:FMN-binding protein [Sedimentisphaerales bacterium]